MTDLTILYYTAHALWEPCAENVRKWILRVKPKNVPVISVSQRSLDFGQNICVGEIGKSYYNCYKQILTGALAVNTKYIACCEDDTLYPSEHFIHRPTSDNVFAFNNYMYFSEEHGYWRKPGDHGMCGCIVSTKLLIETIQPRFDKFPEEPDRLKGQKYWQEPGRFDYKFGISNAKTETFSTKIPLLTFNYYKGLGGKKYSAEHEPERPEKLPGWGDGTEVWHRFWKGTV